MMGISPAELVLIAIVALVVIGPKDLPAALRSMGRTVRTLRRMAGAFQSQVDELVRDSEIDTLRREITDMSKSTGKTAAKRKGEPVGAGPPSQGGAGQAERTLKARNRNAPTRTRATEGHALEQLLPINHSPLRRV
jgi:Tat protein translocase TatB subunit